MVEIFFFFILVLLLIAAAKWLHSAGSFNNQTPPAYSHQQWSLPRQSTERTGQRWSGAVAPAQPPAPVRLNQRQRRLLRSESRRREEAAAQQARRQEEQWRRNQAFANDHRLRLREERRAEERLRADDDIANEPRYTGQLVADHRIDCHGMLCDEAVQNVHELLQNLLHQRSTQKKTRVCVITGKGIHSANFEALLRPSVLDYLWAACNRDQRLSYGIPSDNTGCIYVTIKRW